MTEAGWPCLCCGGRGPSTSEHPEQPEDPHAGEETETLRGHKQAACSKDPAPGCSCCFTGRRPVEGVEGREGSRVPLGLDARFRPRKGGLGVLSPG